MLQAGLSPDEVIEFFFLQFTENLEECCLLGCYAVWLL
jgi:hypothetical protein